MNLAWRFNARSTQLFDFVASATNDNRAFQASLARREPTSNFYPALKCQAKLIPPLGVENHSQSVRRVSTIFTAGFCICLRLWNVESCNDPPPFLSMHCHGPLASLHAGKQEDHGNTYHTQKRQQPKIIDIRHYASLTHHRSINGAVSLLRRGRTSLA